MIITAVSKSDEGFYKCKYDGTDSPQSWMAVELSRPAKQQATSSSFLVGLCVGLVVVFLLIILLILLLHYRRSKDPHGDRSIQLQATNQSSATDQSVNQREAPDNHDHIPLQHGGPAAELSDVTYSLLELKNLGKKKGKRVDPSESAVYSDLKMGSATERVSAGESDVTYAQVNRQNKATLKDNNQGVSAGEPDVTYAQVNRQDKVTLKDNNRS
ncbi:uncharacterized protein ACJ7VT_012935 [Polymixia lowei]